MRIRVTATDDVIISECPMDDSWIIMDHLHRIGARARGGWTTVPVHFPSVSGCASIVYAVDEGAQLRVHLIKRAQINDDLLRGFAALMRAPAEELIEKFEQHRKVSR